MNPRVLSAMSNQHGLITREQAMNAGLDEHQVRRRVRSASWVVVRRGVYADAAAWEALDEHTGRPLARSRAAHYTMRLPHVMSHDSAALELGMAVLRQQPELVHVTRPDVLGSRTEFGVKHHGAVYHQDLVVTIGGIDVLGPARTAVDIAREHGLLPGVVAADAALRLGVPRHQLTRAYEPMRCWPGVTDARAAVELADPGAESVGESLLRLLLVELGIGPVETQFEIRDGGRTARCDLRVGRQVFEFDGRIKYRGRSEGGVADRSPEQVLWEEKRRQDWVCGYRLGMSRVVWSELWEPARSATKARLLREYGATLARYGSDLSDLGPLIVGPKL